MSASTLKLHEVAPVACRGSPMLYKMMKTITIELISESFVVAFEMLVYRGPGIGYTTGQAFVSPSLADTYHAPQSQGFYAMQGLPPRSLDPSRLGATSGFEVNTHYNPRVPMDRSALHLPPFPHGSYAGPSQVQPRSFPSDLYYDDHSYPLPPQFPHHNDRYNHHDTRRDPAYPHYSAFGRQ